MKKAPRAKPGPKPKPDEEKAKKVSVSLKQETYQGLLDMNVGGVSQAIEAMYVIVNKRRKRTV